MKTATLFVIALGVAAPAAAGAQAPGALPSQAPAAVPASAPTPSPAALPQLEQAPTVIPVGTRVGATPSGYESSGRRDPFISLIAPRYVGGAPAGDMPSRPRTGLGSVAVTDVVVRGITKAGTKMFAIIEAPDKQSFVARLSDKLLDGSVKRIDGDAVVFLDSDGQEIRKVLRPVGEVIR